MLSKYFLVLLVGHHIFPSIPFVSGISIDKETADDLIDVADLFPDYFDVTDQSGSIISPASMIDENSFPPNPIEARGLIPAHSPSDALQKRDIYSRQFRKAINAHIKNTVVRGGIGLSFIVDWTFKRLDDWRVEIEWDLRRASCSAPSMKVKYMNWLAGHENEPGTTTAWFEATFEFIGNVGGQIFNYEFTERFKFSANELTNIRIPYCACNWGKRFFTVQDMDLHDVVVGTV